MLKNTKTPVPAWIGDRAASFIDGQWVVVFADAHQARREMDKIRYDFPAMDVGVDRVPGEGTLWYIGEAN
jgi:hypothetical protein